MSLRNLGIIFILAIITVPMIYGGYPVFVLNLMGVYAIAAIGYNLLGGTTGQISLGHQGFFAIGAYTETLVMLKLGLPFPLAMICGGVIAAAAGIILGIPSLRLSGVYLSIATLAFGISIQKIITIWKSLTNGAFGLSVPNPELFGINFREDERYFYALVLVVLAIAIITAVNIGRSRSGRAMVALKENPIAAACVGIDLTAYKLLSFVISAFFTGVAGAMYAHLVGFVAPDNFELHLAIMFLSMIVLGGSGSVIGAILGAVFVTGLPEVLKSIQDWQRVVYGLIMILVILYQPSGLVGLGKSIQKIFRRMLKPIEAPTYSKENSTNI